MERYLDLEAEKVPPGSDGLMVILDWLAPTEAPFKKGSIVGFDVRHGRFHIYRAILEGIALTIYRCAMAMGKETGETVQADRRLRRGFELGRVHAYLRRRLRDPGRRAAR